jgi:xanthine dehydrogenase accessory factor
MDDFYELLNGLHPDYDNREAIIIEGEHFGEKALFSKGEMIYETKKGSFSEDLKKVIQGDHFSGLIQKDGQRVFCEVLGSEKKLVICGGGHVSIPIIKIGKMLEFHVTVIEDRPFYADHARNAKADVVLCDDFRNALGKITGDLDTYFVIVTRGHRFDQVCLEEILSKNNAYIGMIGSKVRVKQVKELLMEKGIQEEQLSSIYSPIGLKIGAETPEEIAVSVMAEIIQVKNQGRRSGGYPKEIRKAILAEDTKEVPKVLATIVSRKGSAPREVGTKMIIYKDGTTVGTIGGGCVEADVCRNAHTQLMEADKKPKLYTVDMTGRDAEEEGMVCGGIVEILLEPIP